MTATTKTTFANLDSILGLLCFLGPNNIQSTPRSQQKRLGLGGAHENKGREVKRLFAGRQARAVLIVLYFPGHQYKEPFKKIKVMESVPCSPLLRAFCKKMLIAASNPPAALGSAKTKLLNLGEGGKVSQPDAGLGKVERRRERVKFQNKGSTRN